MHVLWSAEDAWYSLSFIEYNFNYLIQNDITQSLHSLTQENFKKHINISTYNAI